MPENTVWKCDFSTSDYSSLLLDLASKGQFKKLEWTILLHNDDLEGVKSHIELNAKYPTGIALVRKAMGNINSVTHLPPDHPLIESNNTLLRTLSTMRAINFMLEKDGKRDLQTQLHFGFMHIVEEINHFQIMTKNGGTPFNKMDTLEKRFNIFLKHILITAGFAEKHINLKDFEIILTHYRNLASTLEPAKSIVTIQQYGAITHQEIAHPITRKTAVQKKQLSLISSANTDFSHFHNTQLKAIQVANFYFHDLIKQDDRFLPSGSRFTIAPTVKNGYVVHNQLIKNNSVLHELWFTRGGSLVYVGTGESPERQKYYAMANLEQVQEHIARLRYQQSVSKTVRIHLANLLTNSTLDSQSTIITSTKAAKEQLDPSGTIFNWSNIPLNAEGFTTRGLEISRLIREIARENDVTLPSQLPEVVSPTNFLSLWGKSSISPVKFYYLCQAERLKKALQIIELATKRSIVTNYISCVSGQDRTGTACEAMVQKWLETNLSPFRTTLEEIQLTRSLACHNAILSGLAAPGSTGMKPISQPEEYFPKYMVSRLYRSSANTGADTKNSNPITDETTALKIALEEVIASTKGTLEDVNSALIAWADAALLYGGIALNITRSDNTLLYLHNIFTRLPSFKVDTTSLRTRSETNFDLFTHMKSFLKKVFQSHSPIQEENICSQQLDLLLEEIQEKLQNPRIITVRA